MDLHYYSVRLLHWRLSMEGSHVKLSVFRKLSENLSDDTRLVVRTESMFVGLGGTPTVEVQNAFPGIDWDQGELIITTQTPVQDCGEDFEFQQKIHRMQEDLILRLDSILKDKATVEVKQDRIRHYINAYREKVKSLRGIKQKDSK